MSKELKPFFIKENEGKAGNDKTIKWQSREPKAFYENISEWLRDTIEVNEDNVDIVWNEVYWEAYHMQLSIPATFHAYHLYEQLVTTILKNERKGFSIFAFSDWIGSLLLYSLHKVRGYDVKVEPVKVDERTIWDEDLVFKNGSEKFIKLVYYENKPVGVISKKYGIIGKGFIGYKKLDPKLMEWVQKIKSDVYVHRICPLSYLDITDEDLKKLLEEVIVPMMINVFGNDSENLKKIVKLEIGGRSKRVSDIFSQRVSWETVKEKADKIKGKLNEGKEDILVIKPEKPLSDFNAYELYSLKNNSNNVIVILPQSKLSKQGDINKRLLPFFGWTEKKVEHIEQEQVRYKLEEEYKKANNNEDVLKIISANKLVDENILMFQSNNNGKQVVKPLDPKELNRIYGYKDVVEKIIKNFKREKKESEREWILEAKAGDIKLLVLDKEKPKELWKREKEYWLCEVAWFPHYKNGTQFFWATVYNPLDSKLEITVPEPEEGKKEVYKDDNDSKRKIVIWKTDKFVPYLEVSYKDKEKEIKAIISLVEEDRFKESDAKKENAVYLAIDLGTSNTCIAFTDEGYIKGSDSDNDDKLQLLNLLKEENFLLWKHFDLAGKNTKFLKRFFIDGKLWEDSPVGKPFPTLFLVRGDEEEEVFGKGNIYWHKENDNENLQEELEFLNKRKEALQTNIKWQNDPDTISTRKAYIRQLLYHAKQLIKAKNYDLNKVHFLISYPTAMDSTLKQTIEGNWKDDGIKHVWNLQNDNNVEFISEAIAAAHFIGASKETQALVVDIGGNTTDVALWKEGKIKYHFSFKLAGKDIVEPVLPVKEYLEFIRVETKSVNTAEVIARLYWDKIISYYSKDYDHNERKTRDFLIFIGYVGLLLIILYILKKRNLLEKDKTLRIHLLGNGGKFLYEYFIKRPDVVEYDKIVETIEEKFNVKVDIKPSSEWKAEVAKGMIEWFKKKGQDSKNEQESTYFFEDVYEDYSKLEEIRKNYKQGSEDKDSDLETKVKDVEEKVFKEDNLPEIIKEFMSALDPITRHGYKGGSLIEKWDDKMKNAWNEIVRAKTIDYKSWLKKYLKKQTEIYVKQPVLLEYFKALLKKLQEEKLGKKA